METGRTIEEHEQKLPIACLLPEENRRSREEELASEIFGAVQEIKELPDGYALRFPGDAEWITKLSEFVAFERVCCPFFTFEMTFEPAQGPIWLSLRGPEGTKEFVRSFGESPVKEV
jgi:hypothetical protein